MTATDTTLNLERYDLGAARRAILAIFAINGFVVATWVAYIPIVKERFGLGDGALGLTLLAGAIGSIIALLLSGGLIARFGSRRVTGVGTIALCVALPMLVLNPSYPLLVVVFFLFMASAASMDVAMNSQAVAVETRVGRPIMSAFHGLFSAGALFGAGLASIALSTGIAQVAHVVGVAVVLGFIGALSLRSLLPAAVDQTTGVAAFVRPTGPLISLGILALLALISEGAISDWSAVYLHEGLGTNPGFAALGFAAFSLTMTLGRFAGDPLRAKIPAVQLVRLSGGLAATALGIGLLIGNPLAAIVGFACVGIGLSNVVPVVFSAAGQTNDVATGTAVSAVATAGYLGFIVGPPTIGFVSQGTSLTGGLAVVVVALALIGILAGNVRPAISNVRDDRG